MCEHVTKYDVAGLYESIISSVDIQNHFIFWHAFEDFVVARPEKGEDIFTAEDVGWSFDKGAS